MMANDNNASNRNLMEQKINEMVQQSRVLESYMNEIITREATIGRLMEEARLASDALQNINNNDSNLESLTPIGGGVYIKTIVPPISKLLINVGAGITIEKNKDDTLNYVEERIKEYELALKQLANQKQQVETQLAQIQAHVNGMIQQASSNKSA